MRAPCLFVVVGLIGTAAAADPPKVNPLTEPEIADGWVSLFDGETTFGLTVVGAVKVVNNTLEIGGPAGNAGIRSGPLPRSFEVLFDAKADGRLSIADGPFHRVDINPKVHDWKTYRGRFFTVPNGQTTSGRLSATGVFEWCRPAAQQGRSPHLDSESKRPRAKRHCSGTSVFAHSN